MSIWQIFVRQFVTLHGYELVLQGLLNTIVIAVFGLIFGFLLGSFIVITFGFKFLGLIMEIMLSALVDLFDAFKEIKEL